MTTQIIEGQIGDLYSKERNLIPRVCHLQIKGIQLQIPIKTPKTFIISICLNKNKSSEFISNISTVCFTTNDLLLLRGTPEDRRKWLDLAIFQVYPL